MRLSQINPIGNVTNRITEPQAARTRGLFRTLEAAEKLDCDQPSAAKAVVILDWLCTA